ncbi:cold-shock protein [Aeromonas hydrophila]|uniref:cold-shock protein n=1 Tax=Aeromonas hydrophila TaxID=644 RepID=UPI0020A175BA|nr:cold shock domain-containing protein [Aeromonas hydrophila]MCP1265758.1 cold shock domain-containing protein [Aeromonas hydrophila]MCP1295601.1 cold shock domain-containing protein [Aeromonas hydrophila]
MRYQGRIVRWNEARGFGFIAPEQGDGEPKGAELFVHISALQSDGSLPKIGERVSYQLGTGQDGKPRAEQVFFPDRPLSLAGAQPVPSAGRQAVTGERPMPTRARPRPVYRRRSNWRGKLIPLLVLAGVFSIYSRFSAESVSPSPTSSFSQQEADSTDSPQAAPTFVRQCDGRQYCSQMTSCEEATWFLQNCPNTKMDGRGRGNGIPCESQWCGH